MLMEYLSTYRTHFLLLFLCRNRIGGKVHGSLDIFHFGISAYSHYSYLLVWHHQEMMTMEEEAVLRG